MPQALGWRERRSTLAGLMEQPVRCEFFDDEIDSLGAFDPGTQRRTENVSSALLLPAADASLALRGFRLLAESYPEYVSYKEMNDYGK